MATEGEDAQVELYATCRGRYSSSFFLPVLCVPYFAPGVIPGLYTIVVHKSDVQYYVGNYCNFRLVTEV